MHELFFFRGENNPHYEKELNGSSFFSFTKLYFQGGMTMKFPMRLPQSVTRLAGRIFLTMKKVSPEVCVVGGVILSGAAVVVAVKKTWDNKEKLSEDVKTISEIKANEEKTTEMDEPNGETVDVIIPALSEEEQKKELTKARIRFGKDICKTYWMPVVLFISSSGLIWGGRTLLRKELSAITAAYATLLDIHNKYRQRVVEEFGAEKDQEFEYGVKMEERVDAETGEVTQTAVVDNSRVISKYARWFDEGMYDSTTGQWLLRNYYWRRNPVDNQMKIKEVQDWANRQLHIYGHLFLNAVYKELGLPPTAEGQIVGWDLAKDPHTVIDFRVFDGAYQLPVNKNFFMTCKSPNALLDFNVHGPILSALEKTWGIEETAKLVTEMM